MILQALARYYDILAADPDCPIARMGYSTTSASLALVLSEQGALRGILPLVQTQQNGKKMVEVPLRLVVPERVVRTVGVKANYLCDTSTYVLGISERDATEPSYAKKRFSEFRNVNLQFLETIDCPEARAVAAFLRAHIPQHTRDNPTIAAWLDKLLENRNLVFKLEGSSGFVHDAPEVRSAWEARKAEVTGGTEGQCLVTGQWAKIARLHPNLKGIKGGQTMGASLVGFNAPAYESYNRAKGQGWNAPTSEKAVFAYTTALNYLLSRESDTPKFSIGDTTIVYWAESPDHVYTELFSALFDPAWAETGLDVSKRNTSGNQRLSEIAQKIREGAPFDIDQLFEELDPNTRFYVLGVAPNAARAAVRFFIRDPFQKMIRHLMAHHEDMRIQREYAGQPAWFPPHAIVVETVSKKATNESPSPLMAGALMRSILTGAQYPAALYYAILNRIRADSDDAQKQITKINGLRAAVIKAYLARKYRNSSHAPIQEVFSMALNEQSTHPAYLFGRLFAALEKAQEEAIENANATIKDRFFSSACASPLMVFPRLLRLSQHHLEKLSPGRKVQFEKLIGEIMGHLNGEPRPFPASLSLDDQGAFVLGYYHQRNAFFMPKAR
jgi:CRISPR-associated protein Csd1